MIGKAELEKLGLPIVYVRIGEVDIIGEIQQEQLEQLKLDLKKAGLVLMDNKKAFFEIQKSSPSLSDAVLFRQSQLSS